MTEEEVQGILDEVNAIEDSYADLIIRIGHLAQENAIAFEELAWLNATFDSSEIAMAFETTREVLQAALDEAAEPTQQDLI